MAKKNKAPKTENQREPGQKKSFEFTAAIVFIVVAVVIYGRAIHHFFSVEYAPAFLGYINF